MISFDIDDASGDGAGLQRLPTGFRGVMRRFGSRWEKKREKRLLAVAERIFPLLCELEEKALSSENWILKTGSFADGIQNDRSLERGLVLFEGALENKLIHFWNGEGSEREAYTDVTQPLGACGLSLEDARAYFLERSAEIIFKDNPTALEKLRTVGLKLDSLPKLRILAEIDPLALDELQKGLGRSFGDLVIKKDYPFVKALSKLKAFHVRSMNKIMEKKVQGILFWEAERVDAVIRNFECVEQFTDMAELFEHIGNPDVLDAIGTWEKRDITEKVNSERRTKGLKVLKGRRFETDIGVIRRMLGPHFATLLSSTPDMIRIIGKLVANVRLLPDEEQEKRREEFQTFIRRYIEYLNVGLLRALTVVGDEGDEKLSYREIIAILDGIWAKPNFGAPFFEGIFQTGPGALGIAALVHEFVDLKKRGTIKEQTDIVSIISSSDLFDKVLIPLNRMK